MEYLLKTEQIANGVYFNHIKDKRYKTNRISVNLTLPLDKKTATANALLPFILQKGYADCPDFTELNRKLDGLYGAYLDGGVKKLGDNQIITLAISSIDDEFALHGEEITKELSELLCGIVMKPNIIDGGFDPKDFDLEKQNLIDLIESEINEKRSYAISRAEQEMFCGKPAGVNRYGSIETAKTLTSRDVLLAYNSLLKSAQVEIMFVGCGDYNVTKNIFKSAWSGIVREDINVIKSNLLTDKRDVKEVTEKLSVAQSKMVLGFKTGQQSETEINAIRLMTSLYGGTPTSKLFVNVREKLSLCYYCAARYDRIKGVMLVDCGVENDNIEKARAAILEQLEGIKQGKITDTEIDYTRLSEKNKFKTVTDTTSGMESWYLAQRLSGTTTNPEDEAIAMEQVTKQDIINTANNMTLDTVYVLTTNNQKRQ